MVHEGSSPSFPTIQDGWYNFIMENALNQEHADPDFVATALDEVIPESTRDVVTDEDYTKVDESDVVWAAI